MINLNNKDEMEGKKFKILIVDDNMENIQVIGNLLMENYLLGFAFNGEQALTALRKTNDYDLVLMDVDMPVKNGYETCDSMRHDEQLKDIPVIFLTGYTEIENMIMGFNLGAQDYVTKPFHSWELLARVKTQLLIKQKADQIKEYATELENLNATKNKFFSIIAHDVKNPFASILMVSGILQKKSEKLTREEKDNLVGEINATAKNGYSLLENLLKWAQSQTGKIKVKPVTVSLKTIIGKCIEWSGASAKGIKLINKTPADITIITDENIVETILRNLLSNAVKYTQESGTITVSSELKQKVVEVSVIDTGIGMSKMIQDKLFRIDSNISSMPGTHNEAGTGLGLIVSKEFVEKLGGRIWVESEEGKGSAFRFTIPIMTASPQ